MKNVSKLEEMIYGGDFEGGNAGNGEMIGGKVFSKKNASIKSYRQLQTCGRAK